jgi:hypothetical protein
VKRTKVDVFPDLPKDMVVPVLLIDPTVTDDPSEKVSIPDWIPEDVPCRSNSLMLFKDDLEEKSICIPDYIQFMISLVPTAHIGVVLTRPNTSACSSCPFGI